MKCEQAREMMHSSIDELLNQQELHKLNSHLDSCESCTVEFEEIKYMIQLMGEIDLKELPLGFEEELHNKLIVAANELKSDGIFNVNHKNISGSWLSQIKTSLNNFTFKRKYLAWAAVPVMMFVILTASQGLLGRKNSEDVMAYDANAIEPTMAYGAEGAERSAVSPEMDGDQMAKSSEESYTLMETNTAADTMVGVNITQSTTETSPDATYRESRMIIQTASIKMDVEKYDSVLEQIKAQVATAGGYVENESTSFQYTEPNEQKLKYGYITLRVPAASYDSVLGSIKAFGLVTLDSSNASDVTKAYRDTASEVENLKVTENRLREIMTQAVLIEDILSIENELTRVRGNINMYEKQLKDWEALVDMTTVFVEITEVKSLKPTVESIDESLFGKAKDGFIQTINGVVDTLEQIGRASCRERV